MGGSDRYFLKLLSLGILIAGCGGSVPVTSQQTKNAPQSQQLPNQQPTEDSSPQIEIIYTSWSESPSNQILAQRLNFGGQNVTEYKAIALAANDCTNADPSSLTAHAIAEEFTFTPTEGANIVCAWGLSQSQIQNSPVASRVLRIDTQSPQAIQIRNQDLGASPTNILSARSVQLSGSEITHYKAIARIGEDCSSVNFTTTPERRISEPFLFTPTANTSNILCAIGRDEAGNYQTQISQSAVLVTDTLSPVVAIADSSLAPSPSNNLSPRTVNFSGLEVVQVKVLHRSASDCSSANFSGVNAQAVSSSFTFTPTNNSPNIICAVGLDALGNQQETPTASRVLVIDTISPAFVQIDSTGLGASPSRSLTARSVTLSGTGLTHYKAIARASTTCSLADLAQVAEREIALPFSFTPTANSPNVVCAIGRDAIGNYQVSISLSSVLVIDTIAPSLTVMDSSMMPSPSNDLSARSIQFLSNDATHYKAIARSSGSCSGADFTGVATRSITEAFSFIPTENASNIVCALGIDAAGNQQTTPISSRVLVIDTVPPASIVINSTGLGASPSRSLLPRTISFLMGGLTHYKAIHRTSTLCTLQDLIGAPEVAITESFTFTPIANASNIVCAIGRDQAGNYQTQVSQSSVLVIDVAAPTVIIEDSSLSPSPSRTLSRSVSFSGTDVATVKARHLPSDNCNGADFSGVTAIPVSQSFAFTAQANGPNIVCAIGLDIAGNEQATPTASRVLVTDTTPPANIQIDASGLGVSPTNNLSMRTLTLSGPEVTHYKAIALNATSCTVGQVSGAPERSIETPFTFTPSANVSVIVCALGRDAVGNYQTLVSLSPVLVTDTNAPQAAVGNLGVSPSTDFSPREASISGVDVTHYKVILREGRNCTGVTDFSAQAERSVSSSYRFTPISSDLSFTDNVLCVIGRDLAGNWQALPTRSSVLAIDRRRPQLRVQIQEPLTILAHGANIPRPADRLVGTAPVQQTFRIENTGTLPMELSGWTLPSGYTTNSSLPSFISHGTGVNISIQINPQTVGDFGGFVSFVSNGASTVDQHRWSTVNTYATNYTRAQGWFSFWNQRYVGDFDADGRDDIAFHETNGNINILSSTGSGWNPLAPRPTPLTAANGWFIYPEQRFSGDFDGDGLTDILAQTTSGTLQYFRNSGSAFTLTDQTPTSFSLMNGWFGSANQRYIADFDGDGADDVAFHYASGYIAVYRHTAAGFTFWRGFTTDLSAANGWYQTQDQRMAGDVDADGRADLVTVDMSGGVRVYLNTMTELSPQMVTATDYSQTQDWFDGRGRRFLKDVSGDNRADLLFADQFGNTIVWCSTGVAYQYCGRTLTNYSRANGYFDQNQRALIGKFRSGSANDLVIFDDSGNIHHHLGAMVANANGQSPFDFYLSLRVFNNVPIAQNQSIEVYRAITHAITLGASDQDLQNLNYEIVSPPQHGTLTGSGGNRFYRSSAGFIGADSFTFRVSDGHSYSNVATVLISVVLPYELFRVRADGTEEPVTLPILDPLDLGVYSILTRELSPSQRLRVRLRSGVARWYLGGNGCTSSEISVYSLDLWGEEVGEIEFRAQSPQDGFTTEGVVQSTCILDGVTIPVRVTGYRPAAAPQDFAVLVNVYTFTQNGQDSTGDGPAILNSVVSILNQRFNRNGQQLIRWGAGSAINIDNHPCYEDVNQSCLLTLRASHGDPTRANIFIVNRLPGSVAGYTYRFQNPGQYDGAAVVIRRGYATALNGVVTTHEWGHAIGLPHTAGNEHGGPHLELIYNDYCQMNAEFSVGPSGYSTNEWPASGNIMNWMANGSTNFYGGNYGVPLSQIFTCWSNATYNYLNP